MLKVYLLIIMVCYKVGWTVELVGSYDTPGVCVGVAILGNYAYVADESAGLRVINISDPAQPVLAGSLYIPDFAIDVTIEGHYAYVANGITGISIVDVSNPNDPMLVGNYDTAGSAIELFVNGEYLYVANYSAGLLILDISDPTQPSFISDLSTPGYANGISFLGDYAYIAAHSAGLQVVDISNPSAPIHVVNLCTPGTANGIVLSGNTAYMCTLEGGLHLINIGNPAHPVLIKSYNPYGLASSIATFGNYTYVAAYIGGLQVVDISNPAYPVLAENISTPGDARDLVISGRYAYVADGSSGLQIYNIEELMYSFSANAFVGSNYMVVEYNLRSILLDNIDSLGVWWSYKSYPESIIDSTAKLFSVSSVNDSCISEHIEINSDSIYYLSIFQKDTTGSWIDSPIARTSACLIYDFSLDSLIIQEIFKLNNLQNVSVCDVADTINGRVRSLDLSNYALELLPDCINRFSRLENLSLENNLLSNLPDSIIKLDDLLTLNLSYNYLELKGLVKNWALVLDEDYQLTQVSLNNQLYINNYLDRLENGFIDKSVIVISPEGEYARTSLFLTYADNSPFYNSGWDHLGEINHLFTLPDSAIVIDLWLWMEDSVMQARMFDINTAESIYDSIVATPVRIDPAILTKEGNHYELKIYPYISGDVARIKITYLLPVTINGDTAVSQVPVPMLDLSNNLVKPITILFKEKLEVMERMPVVVEAVDAVFEHNKDTLGYRYFEAHIDDISCYSELNVAYCMNAVDTQAVTNALVQANVNINYLYTQEPVDTATIVDSSIYYNILTDFTALLALEPDATNHFMVDPLDEGNFVDPILDPMGIDNALDLLEFIAFKIDPNPFSTHTNITFTLEHASFVQFEIFSPTGALLKNVHTGTLSAGQQRLTWDGRTDAGASLEKGTYIFRIEVGGRVECGKVMKF